MLLPYDIRVDRDGWSVVEVETDLPTKLDSVTLTGLSLEDAERLTNALNAMEVRCVDLARRRVLDDLGVAWLFEPVAGPKVVPAWRSGHSPKRSSIPPWLISASEA